MPILKTFEWEIFLSYGWAENPQHQGTRAWAQSLKNYIENRLGSDIGAPRIYFDMGASREGTLKVELGRAVERSALMVFIVSPGSYRAKSYCQMEVVEFWDHAKPLASGGVEPLAPENRIFKIIQAPVSPGLGTEPEPLRDHPAYQLFDRATGLSQSFSELNEEALQELDNFYGQLVEALKRVKKLESWQPSGLRVFLGPVYSGLHRRQFQDLRRELLIGGHEVVSVTPLPADTETEEDLRGRLEQAHEGARLAVHFVPDHRETPSGWVCNFAANQIAYSTLMSAGQELFSVYAWQDPTATRFDNQCLSQLDEVARVTGNQTPKFMVFQDLKAEVKKRLAETPKQSVSDVHPFDVVIEHWDVDADKAAEIRRYLKSKGRIAQSANPTDRTSRSNEVADKNSKMFYPRASRFLVLYGQADNEWANDVCYAMKPFAKGDKAGLVLLVPPPEPPTGKQYYEHPADVPFLTEDCTNGPIFPILDKWLGLPVGGE